MEKLLQSIHGACGPKTSQVRKYIDPLKQCGHGRPLYLLFPCHVNSESLVENGGGGA